MLSKTQLLLVLPFLLLPFLVVLSLSSCQRSAPPPAANVLAARQAVSGPACSPGAGCATLDEFDPIDGGGWLTFSCDGGGCACDGGGTCDITTALQVAVNTIVQNTGSNSSLPTILYIPPGTYDISSTIFVQGAYGGTIYGDDPSTTVLNWTGPVGGTEQLDDVASGTTGNSMILLLDSYATRVARITLNGGLSSAPVALTDGGAIPWVAGVQIMQSLGTPPLSLDGGEWDGGIAPYWPTNNLELDDDVFENLSFGLAMFYAAEYEEVPGSAGFFENGPNVYNFVQGHAYAASDGNDAFWDVRRSSFENIYVQAIGLVGSNTLDYLIEDNAFINCHRGVSLYAYPSANLVNNLFFNNNGDDSVNIFNTSNMFSVYRGNVSVGANMFYFDNGVGHADFSGNYIVLNPEAPDAGAGNQHCFGLHTEGSLIFLDNYVNGPDNDDSCSLEVAASCTDILQYEAIGVSGDIAHGHNAYNGTAAGFVGSIGTSPARELCVGGSAGCPDGGAADTFGATGADAPDAAASAYQRWGSPTLYEDTASVQRPTIAPKVTSRTVYNVLSSVPDCASSINTDCATTLNSTLSGWSSGTQYLLYFPAGLYYLDRQIDIPPNLDVVILGDGPLSHIVWTGTALDSYMFHAKAPSRAMLKNLLLDAEGSTSRPGGILVDSADDTGGLVYVDDCGFGNARSGLEVAGLDKVLVRAEQVTGGLERGADVIGGGSGYQDGGAQSSQTQGLFMIAGGLFEISSFLTVRNWGKAVLLGTDSEGIQGMVLNQSGYVTVDTGRFITAAQPYPELFPRQPNVVAQSTFRGNLTFANMQTQGGVFSAGAQQAQVLALQNSYFTAGSPLDSEEPLIPACVYGQVFGCSSSPLTVDAGFVEQTSAGVPQMGLQNSGACLPLPGAKGYADTTNGATPPNTFADTMLADLRNAPYAAPICPASCGQTQVRIHNVFTTGGAAPPSHFMRSGLRVQRSN